MSSVVKKSLPALPSSPLLPEQPRLDFRLKLLAASTVVLILCFIAPLSRLVRFALHSELYSYILLVPFITAYLVWLRIKSSSFSSSSSIPNLPSAHKSSRPLVFVLTTLGILSLLTPHFARSSHLTLAQTDLLALTTFSFVAFFLAACCFLLAQQTVRRLGFPLCFLLFMIPFPKIIEHGFETFLQHTSAWAAGSLLSVSGMPVLREQTVLQLPGFSMQVAPECSGIHSTLVLFITALLAGHLLLHRPWSTALLAFAVIPLGIVRNAIRIFTLGQLCVRVNPTWIDSDLHHRGGPIFFAISLPPLFILLWFLRRSELKTLTGSTAE